MWVDVTGMSGAGKTHFLSRMKGVKFTFTFTDLLRGFAFMLMHPEFLFFLWKGVTKQINQKGKLSLVLNVVAKFCLVYDSARYSEMWVDEGLFHIPFLLNMNPQELDQFIASLQPYIDNVLVVMIACDQQIALSRLLSRGHNRFITVEEKRALCLRHAGVQKILIQNLPKYKIKTFVYECS